MNKALKLGVVAGMVVATFVFSYDYLPTKRNRYIKLCEPHFYSHHIEIAHGLDMVNCVNARGGLFDENENHLTKYVITR